MRQVIDDTHAVVHREKPYVMPARLHWTGEEVGYETVHVKKKSAWDESVMSEGKKQEPRSWKWWPRWSSAKLT